MKTKIIAFFILPIFLGSCTYNNEDKLYPDTICDTSNVTYTKDIQPIFATNCYSCHSSNAVEIYGNLNLENFLDIQRVVDNGKLLKNIRHEPDGTPMPKGAPKLSDCKISKIEKWIDLGASLIN